MTTSPRVRLAATDHEPARDLPAIGQGTWYLGEGLAPREDEVRALQHGLAHGLTLIDTAEMYGDGGAEEVVGEALADRRDEAFLVSKVYPWNAGRDSAIAACEASLRRLRTDHLDLYLLHWPGSISLDETLEAFERLREAGKIRRFGVSNFDVEEMAALSALPGGAACAVNQVLYHLGSRGIEHSLLPWQRERGIPTMAYCPLAQAGTLRRDLLGHPEVKAVAAELGITPTQLLLAWAISPNHGARDVIAIPKATQLEHVEQNAAALAVELDAESLARLDAVFPAPSRKTALDIV
ncbi:diketogulonate reductase-like aldo/keto reductase [Halomonas ventosae]|uniref:Diketogulonate reductase-like aldo/keto reductase n=1 Tax=Halomonas ventosae TaxID=229007 RepID=A0A4R6ZTV6_9GAMM|nr:aldo/keto reductase [Halomonas ventosae]TDR55902.1 diketogulonate reductase-like aldo/keto reductase [Halomonas ventosae]